MRSSLLFLLVVIVTTFSAQAQQPEVSPTFYMSRFQYFVGECKDPAIQIDSALFFARKLANDKRRSFLHDLLHNSFALQFFFDFSALPANDARFNDLKKDTAELNRSQKRMAINRLLLSRMASDTCFNLSATVQDLQYWVKVRELKNDTAQLRLLINGFLHREALTPDLYQNKTGRYAMLIYQAIASNPSLQDVAQQLFFETTTRFRNTLDQLDSSNADNKAQMQAAKAWYRYLYAWSNAVQGQRHLTAGDTQTAGQYLQVAFNYSPDLTDEVSRSGYIYDVVFLTGNSEVTFPYDYLSWLEKYSGDKQAILTTLLQITLANPTYKEKLKTFYNQHFAVTERFQSYWEKQTSKTLKPAPSFTLQQLNNTPFSIEAYRGKWVLLDFWGTWCGPCCAEHPALQKFYKKTQRSDKLTILTIACRDTEERVRGYLKKKSFTFPVAMADSQVEDIFAVQSYPTKVLINPAGQYLIIPFGINWTTFIEKYCDL
ncbi:MAG: TlpA disulfide reductase family protein [Chitinophagaceae bacterium]